MVGVPSSRACDACRKQKKKCDLAQPACSRCARLQIACIGCGERRFKFNNQIVATSAVNGKLPQPPSNEMTVMASAFVSVLGFTDLRYSLLYYGAFLKDIPRRLGRSDALDASVGALTSAFSSLSTHRQSPDALAKFVHALKTLRIDLSDPTKAQAANTLCAMYLLMVCQSWIGKYGDFCTAHGEVMAYLLNAAAFQDWQGGFESQLLLTLCVPVLSESITNPKIQLHPWFQKLVEQHAPRISKGPFQSEDCIPIYSVQLQSLATIPGFIRDPELHLFEIQATYQQMRLDVPRLRQRLTRWTELASPCATPSFSSQNPITQVYFHHQVAYGILLAVALTLNGILRAYDPDEVTLVEDSSSFTDEVLLVAVDSARFRPIGAGCIPLCLAAAWGAIDDPLKQAKVKDMLADYQTDFVETRWIHGGIWMKNRLNNLRRKLGTPVPVDTEDDSSTAACATFDDLAEPMTSGASCCIL